MNPLARSKPIRIPAPLPPSKENHVTSPDSKYGFSSPENMLATLSLNPKDTVFTQIREDILSFGSNYHGLQPIEIDAIVHEVVDTLSDPPVKKANYRVNKDKHLPRTIFYDLDKQVAYIYLKTKGKLPVKEGTFWLGTRSIRIELGDKISVRKCFQLVAKDEKSDSTTIKRGPFDHRIKKLFTAEQLAEIKKALLPRYEYFTYKKISKKTGKEIEKSCKIYPFMPHDLKEIKNQDTLFTHFHSLAKDLCMLHGFDIVHRDIKRENIVASEKAAKFIDFDKACCLNKEQPPITNRYGTFCYSAPELLEGKVDSVEGHKACDMFAFGQAVLEAVWERSAYVTDLINHKAYPVVHPVEIIIEKSRSDIKKLLESARKGIATEKDKDLFLKMIGVLAVDPNPATRLTAEQFCSYMQKFLDRSLFN